ncbi:phospholipase D4 [Arapaima gigas]
MSSPYRNLHDNYVSNQRSWRRVVYYAAPVGYLSILGFLWYTAFVDKPNQKFPAHSDAGDSNGQSLWDPTYEEHRRLCVTYDQCRTVLVESIPLYMKYDDNATFGVPLYKAWKDLLAEATNSVDVASFYWTLTGPDIGVNSSTDNLGRDILEDFKELPSRNVSVRVAVSIPTLAQNSTDLDVLRTKGEGHLTMHRLSDTLRHRVQVRMVDFGHLTEGILHTKLWVVDMKHIYIGSANMDWRALTQVKELGAVIYDCPHLAEDLQKIFQSYWVMGHMNASIPDPWPTSFSTSINRENPLVVNVSGVASQVYISSSPPSFCPHGRTNDLDAIRSVIKEAEQFIDVAIMEYFPTSRYTKLLSYWPVLDDALKQSAVERQVPVRLLVSCGRDTDPAMLPFLKSLSDLHYPAGNITIEVRLYIVPVVNQSNIPYSRVNHNKYMVTDKVAYIGTSNWSADYFNTTAGVGLVVSQGPVGPGLTGDALQEQLKGVFERDWNSQFAIKLSDVNHTPDCTFAESLGSSAPL